MADRTTFLNTIREHLPANPTCIELGVLHGDFSAQILQSLTPQKLFLVDPFITGMETYSEELNFSPIAYSTEEVLIKIRERFSKQMYSGQVIIRKKYSEDAVQDFADHYFDFIYIDACHLYECVKSDLNGYLPKLKPNGLICGHDYIEHKDFGVIQAVDEFVKENDMNFLVLDNSNFALQRK